MLTTNQSLRRIAAIEIILCMVMVVFIIASCVVTGAYLYKLNELEKMISTVQSSTLTTEDVAEIVDTKILDFEAKQIAVVSEPVIEEPEREVVSPTDTVEEVGVLSNEEIHKDSFIAVLNELAPNLSGIEDALFYNYEEYGITPQFQLAVMCLESGYGTSKLAINKNNLCGYNAYPTDGLSSYENATHFDNKSECVLRFGKTINNSYVGNNLTSISDISKKYCPPNSESWATNVTIISNKIYDMYAKKYSEV